MISTYGHRALRFFICSLVLLLFFPLFTTHAKAENAPEALDDILPDALAGLLEEERAAFDDDTLLSLAEHYLKLDMPATAQWMLNRKKALAQTKKLLSLRFRIFASLGLWQDAFQNADKLIERVKAEKEPSARSWDETLATLCKSFRHAQFFTEGGKRCNPLFESFKQFPLLQIEALAWRPYFQNGFSLAEALYQRSSQPKGAKATLALAGLAEELGDEILTEFFLITAWRQSDSIALQNQAFDAFADFGDMRSARMVLRQLLESKPETSELLRYYSRVKSAKAMLLDYLKTHPPINDSERWQRARLLCRMDEAREAYASLFGEVEKPKAASKENAETKAPEGETNSPKTPKTDMPYLKLAALKTLHEMHAANALAKERGELLRRIEDIWKGFDEKSLSPLWRARLLLYAEAVNHDETNKKLRNQIKTFSESKSPLKQMLAAAMTARFHRNKNGISTIFDAFPPSDTAPFFEWLTRFDAARVFKKAGSYQAILAGVALAEMPLEKRETLAAFMAGVRHLHKQNRMHKAIEAAQNLVESDILNEAERIGLWAKFPVWGGQRNGIRIMNRIRDYTPKEDMPLDVALKYLFLLFCANEHEQAIAWLYEIQNRADLPEDSLLLAKRLFTHFQAYTESLSSLGRKNKISFDIFTHKLFHLVRRHLEQAEENADFAASLAITRQLLEDERIDDMSFSHHFRASLLEHATAFDPNFFYLFKRLQSALQKGDAPLLPSLMALANARNLDYFLVLWTSDERPDIKHHGLLKLRLALLQSGDIRRNGLADEVRALWQKRIDAKQKDKTFLQAAFFEKAIGAYFNKKRRTLVTKIALEKSHFDAVLPALKDDLARFQTEGMYKLGRRRAKILVAQDPTRTGYSADKITKELQHQQWFLESCVEKGYGDNKDLPFQMRLDINERGHVAHVYLRDLSVASGVRQCIYNRARALVFHNVAKPFGYASFDMTITKTKITGWTKGAIATRIAKIEGMIRRLEKAKASLDSTLENRKKLVADYDERASDLQSLALSLSWDEDVYHTSAWWALRMEGDEKRAERILGEAKWFTMLPYMPIALVLLFFLWFFFLRGKKKSQAR